MSKTKFVVALAFLIGTLGAAHAAKRSRPGLQNHRVKQFVDLSHSFGPTTPVWSGFGQAKFTPANDPKTKTHLHDPEGRFPHHLLRDGRAIRHPC